ncbi:hypothetical protein [Sphaerisporangium rhizosphaerae]|uniref:Uncharacterized protein n=1 Tax=Sphaerisporangium rhizosphaerae TaxID=2269375 RepID=A0ABW2P684_9ACTN
MGQYSLPDMPYDYAALEPAITGEILLAALTAVTLTTTARL